MNTIEPANRSAQPWPTGEALCFLCGAVVDDGSPAGAVTVCTVCASGHRGPGRPDLAQPRSTSELAAANVAEAVRKAKG